MNNGTEQIFLVNFAVNQPVIGANKANELSSTSQVNLEDVEDFSNVCRTCATITEFVIPIFMGEGLQNNLADKIQKHLPIEVTEHDLLPRVVCYQCASTLLAWHELVQCCVQADKALKTRLSGILSKDIDTNSEEKSLDSDTKGKFDPTFTPPPPPRYTDAKRLKKRCQYCHVEVPAAGYTDHLIGSHSELLFHCSQCNMYLDRKEFALHASAHHVHASDGDKEANRRTKRTRRRKNSRDRNDNAVSAGKSKASLSAQIIEQTIRRASRNSTTADITTEENEFSDHSDVEYFGRLPESVFQAIEDSESATVDPGSSNVPEDTSDHNEELAPIVKDTEALTAVTSKKHKRPRKCPVCSKVYTASSSYFYHLNSHRQNDFVCSVCGKKLGNKASLVQHGSIHSNERRFECVECGKKFRSRASLYIHSESHRETKNFACDQCDSSFRWRTHLLRHLKRHSAEKTQVCTTCGRGFSVRADLLRHLRTHRAGSHACEKCNAKFAQRRYLKVHMMKKHSIAISGREITQQ